jgi:hypothetical protein
MAKKNTEVDLPEGWRESILNIYRQGASDTLVKTWIIDVRGKFSNHLWNAWLRDSTEFLETIETGRVLSQAWWETKGAQIDSKGFNSSLWHINMKNRFGWTDDKKDSTPIKVELKVDFVKPKG